MLRSLAAGTWNSRALCHREERSMKKKRNYLRCMLKKMDLVCGQEVRGSEEEIRRVLSPFRKGWHFFVNPGSSRNAGGVVVMPRRSIFPDQTTVNEENAIEGRVSRISLATVKD